MSAKLDKHKIAHACSFKTAVVLAVTKSCSVTQFTQGYLLEYSRSRLWWALASRKFLLEGQEKPSLYSV